MYHFKINIRERFSSRMISKVSDYTFAESDILNESVIARSIPGDTAAEGDNIFDDLDVVSGEDVKESSEKKKNKKKKNKNKSKATVLDI